MGTIREVMTRNAMWAWKERLELTIGENSERSAAMGERQQTLAERQADRENGK